MGEAKDADPATLVSPADPDAAEDADDAQPGEVEKLTEFQRETSTGKYGKQPVQPYIKPQPKPGEEDPAKKKDAAWIEVLLIDKEKKPVPGAKYRITLPDNRVAEGTTSAEGLVRIDGLPDPGNCKIEFPELDGKAWSPA